MRFVVAFLFFLPATLPARAADPQTERPANILLITVDTLRADHLSTYGYHLRTSPYMDGLAAAGTRFERAYAAIPLTGPSHFVIFTGRYPQEIGVRRNGVAPPQEVMSGSLPDVLGEHGYRRGAFISGWPLTARLTHLDGWFDDFDEDLNQTYQLFNSLRYAQDVTPTALAWLRAHAREENPFFLWVHYFDPHSPYHAREYFRPAKREGIASRQWPRMGSDMKDRIKAYDSEVYYTDHYIGQMLEELDKLGVADSTLVVLTADHGESLGEHGYVGHGRHLYENIVHVPLIMRLPGKIAAGRTVKTPVSLIDLAPTLIDLALGESSGEGVQPQFTGKSLAAAVVNATEPAARRIYYVTFPGKKGFMPSWLSWMWVREENLPSAFGYADGDKKLVWRPGDRRMRMVDVAVDPLELRPQRVRSGKASYKVQTKMMARWFSLTDNRKPEKELSAHDREVLKSLGYAQ